MPSLALQRKTMEHEPNGGRLVTSDGRSLPLRSAELRADARAGLARVVLEQRFANPFSEPLQVTYQVPLPADGAVGGYAFRIGERRIAGEVDTRRKARERFEEALLLGRTAAVLEQERSSLFTQELGNVPPQTEVVAELTVDQKLAWLPDGFWEWRFPTVAAPRYLGASGRVPDGETVTLDVADRPIPPRLSLALAIRDPVAEGVRPESPSHAVQVARRGRSVEVTLAGEEGSPLDRDMVVRWRTAGPAIGAALDLARPRDGAPAQSAYGLLTIVPPLAEARPAAVGRDLIVLLDTSGSMSGEPLDQARRIVSALVDTLDEGDRLEMIEFSNVPRRWKRKAVEASAPHRREALRWLAALSASGGTEMVAGILEALSPLRDDAQRQVVLVTDGLIGFESEVLRALRERLPASTRLHVVGVGSAVNRSLTGPAARAGRGVEVVVGLGEDPEIAAQRLLARTVAPLVTDLAISGSALAEVAPARAPDLFGGAPALLSLRLQPEGGELHITGRTADGTFERRLAVGPVEPGEGGEAIAKLFARERVEDLELDWAAAVEAREIDARIERIGLEHQISTRLTSWVAVSSEPTVDPKAPRRTVKMPQELPHGMSAEGLGLRPAMAAAPRGMPAAAPVMRAVSTAGQAKALHPASPPFPRERAADRARVSEEGTSEEESLASVSKGGGGPSRTVRARVVLQRDGRLVVQFEIEGAPLFWNPRNVRLEDGTGSVVPVSVEGETTTREGLVGVGLTVTLALDVPPRLGPPRAVRLESAGETLLLLL